MHGTKQTLTKIYWAIIFWKTLEFYQVGPKYFPPHSVPKGPKSGKLKTRKGRTSFKTREGLVQGKAPPQSRALCHASSGSHDNQYFFVRVRHKDLPIIK
jgi:hypothetical protein